MGAWQTLEGIQFKELHAPKRVLELQDQRIRGKRVFLTAWADRLAFLAAITGQVQSAGEDVDINSPVAFPDFPVLRAAEAAIDGLGKSGQLGVDAMASYDFAQISVTYRNFNFDGEGGTFRPDDPTQLRSINITLSGSFLQAPQNHYYWSFEIDGKTTPPEEKREYIDEPIGIVMPLMNLAVTDHRVPALNLALWWGAIGTINENKFEGIDAEHVLYLGLDSRISFNFTSGTPWTITHKFVARSRSWNAFLRPGGTASTDKTADRQWQAITPPPYQLLNFETLFASGVPPE